MNLKPLLLVSAFVAVGAANAVTLAVYNFNDAGASSTNSAANTAKLFAVDRLGANVASSSITSKFNFATITNFGGSTVGANGGDLAGQALALRGAPSTNGTTTYVNNGAYYQFVLNAATGFNLELATLTFAAQRTGTGFTSQAFSYSLDGSSFTALSTVTGIPSAFALQTVDLSAVPVASTIFIRSTLTGVSSNSGNNRLDNFVFDGTTPQAVPEPASFVALGLGALAMLRRRRRAA